MVRCLVLDRVLCWVGGWVGCLGKTLKNEKNKKINTQKQNNEKNQDMKNEKMSTKIQN